MSQNLKSKLKNQSQENEKERNQLSEPQNSNDQESTDVRMLTIEEQLDCFAELLIDLYLLDQQTSNDHED